MKRWLLFGLALTAGCSDALEQTSSAGQVIAVVNSADKTVSFVSATDFSVRPVGLRSTTGVPTTAAGRGTTVIVPLGPADSVAVVRNAGLCTGLCVNSVVVLPLTHLNYQTGDTYSVAVGPTPRAVAIVGGVLYVVNANLAGSTPAGPGSISWFLIRGVRPNPLPTIPLTGTNPQFAVVGDDSLLYVVDRGTPGAGDGKLSIVDPAENREIVVMNGLGESPGAAVFHPSGRLLISSLTDGILEVYTVTRSLTRGPGNGIKPGGDGVSALAVDLRGRVYAVDQGACAGAGTVHVLSAPPDYHEFQTVTVGVCPTTAAVAATP